MADLGRLQKDPLFLGLTRPAMMLGVTYTWFLVNAMIWALYFVNTSDLVRMVPGALITHLVGYFICAKEPRYMDILIIRGAKCTKSRNSIFHGYTQSYDPY